MLDLLRLRLLRMGRREKRLLQVLADVLLIWLSLLMAFMLRLGWDDLPPWDDGFIWLFVFAPLTALPFLIRMGLYRAVLRYIGNEALLTIFKAISLGVLLFAQLLHAATFGSFHAAAIHFVQRSFGPNQQGQGQALYAALAGTGGALGALYAGYSWESLGATWTFAIASLVALAAAFIIAIRLHEERA